MAISWGSWEYSGGNGMRVGLDVSWENVTHGEAAATCTIEIWTENQYSYSDSQTLNYGGAIGGSTSFSNNAGGSPVKRATKTYTYNYGSNEYGSSPGSRTFSASLSGAFNGVTPSKSVSSKIPARPIAAPLDPTNVSISRTSDTSHTLTWTNRSTSGEPWQSVNVDRDVWADDSWGNLVDLSGGASGTHDTSTVADAAYRYRVRAENSAGVSAFVLSGVIYTTPAPPINAVQTPGTGAQQVVSWENVVRYPAYNTEVWVSRNGVWSLLATVASGVTTYTDTAASAAEETKYKVRHKTTGGVQGTLYSDYSADTSGTSGSTSPPNAPTSLSPDGSTIAVGVSNNFTWTHNPVDGSGQTAYQIRYRPVGSTTWTTLAKTTSASASHSFAAGTFTANFSYEWQVMTWGSDPTGSLWSDPVSFSGDTSASASNAARHPLVLNSFTGGIETVPKVRMRRYKTATQSVANAVYVQVTFPAEEYNIGGFNVASDGTVTIPDGQDGLYDIEIKVVYAQSGTGRRILAMTLNSTVSGAIVTDPACVFAINDPPISTGEYVGTIKTTRRLAGGDVLRFWVYQNSGAALNLNTTYGSTEVLIRKVGNYS